MMKVCSADCDRPVHSHGLCVPHRRRQIANGEGYDRSPIREYLSNSEECAVDWCESDVKSKSLCGTHYIQMLRHGRILPKHEKLIENKRVCAEDGCEQITVGKKLLKCEDHITRYSGEPAIFDHLGREWVMDGMNNVGYRVRAFRSGSKRMRRMEHRVIMETVLERELLPNENVHHINGVRWDNRIENLELWVTRQPSGARISDLLDWSRDYLSKYGNESEREFFHGK